MRNKASSIIDDITRNLSFLVMSVALLAIAIAFATANITIGVAIAAIPLVILPILAIINNPFYGFIALLFANYFMIATIRYTNLTGLSIVVDILIAATLVACILRMAFIEQERPFNIFNTLTLFASLWFIYCVFELLNPSSQVDAWITSRGVGYYLLATAIITFATFKKFRKINTIIMMLSIFTLISVGKALMQKYYGFDWAETKDLNDGLARTHLLVSGVRYFSIYPSAGIFGAIMGHAMVVFGILSIYTKVRSKKIYFAFITIAAFYGLMISGTRGALAVPAAGFILFIFLSKSFKVAIPLLILLISTYCFLAFTTIGQSNSEIRRMRTALDPNEPSLVVRLNNQKLLSEYLIDKPFGEGLGLSGVDAKHISERFTTSIPTDSWYVKIWVETGIVGLCLHIAMLAYIIIYGSYIVLFRIRDPEIRSVLTALLCGVFGILISSYGNQVLGQFPVAFIVYSSIALIFMGKYFDKEKSLNSPTLENK